MKNLLLVIVLLLAVIPLPAQIKKAENTPIESRQNLKVLEEHKDNKGNTVRTIQYTQGKKKVTETITIPAEASVNHILVNPDTLNKDSLLIIITKSRYKMEVFYRKQLIRSYKAVFGPKPMNNKNVEGDRCTPEGWFRIQNKNPTSHYNKFLLLDYPNDSTLTRFNALKEKGLIAKTARMGGSVGIHGVFHNADDMIEKRIGWTDGCIALKNKDIDELYKFVIVGTRVFIRK